jgi:hypothetical protein
MSCLRTLWLGLIVEEYEWRRNCGWRAQKQSGSELLTRTQG